MIDIIKDYTAKRLELIKLQLTEKSSLSAGVLVFISLILVASAFFIILFNFGIAFLIGQYLHNTAYGFLIVAGFYLLIMIVLLLIKKMIVNSIANKVIKLLNN